MPDTLTRRHNGGPPLDDDDPGASYRLWVWKRAVKKAWSARAKSRYAGSNAPKRWA